MVHAHAAHAGATVTVAGAGERLAHVDARVWDLLFRCLDPATPDELRAEGHRDDAIDTALSLGLLVDSDDERERAARSWEDHRWTRAAHLLFSQMDLSYVDAAGNGDLTAIRRAEVERRLCESRYPERVVAPGEEIELPRPTADPPLSLLTALAGRRSVRKFTREPVPLATVAAILFDATTKLREAEALKESGDPYLLLSSFYAWLDLRMVNQGVDGLPPGVFQYDPLEHVLRRTGEHADDDEVIATVAQQPWAGGSGAALYVCVQWERFRWLYRHSRAYVNVLIQVGEFAQEVLNGVYRRRLGGWVTPAVQESRAAELLSLPAGVDAMMFVKFGPPRQ
jgi:hypothetical protein